ncbi:UNVERIFIED_CONTAM: hypothetical protein Sangu_0823200 [Sesamum angustifolium]|uniref:Reverse transcriptase zinc-binding domain-containing protein n=1 Tax=Sesamum angustifolium TaxID=2727405 RepID=A0AAW2PWF7_9LAMI
MDPRPASFRIITPNVHNVQNMCVSNLISPITREWDVDTINALLWPVDREAILQIPLSTSGGPDLLIWHYSNNGLFSVRSAYHLALSSFLASNAGTSDGRPRYKKLWKSIWQAKVPSKAKLFIWRAIRNALPTAANLRGKMPHEEIVCPFCTDTDDNNHTHTLHCCFARQELKNVEQGVSTPQQIVDFARTYLMLLCSEFWSVLSAQLIIFGRPLMEIVSKLISMERSLKGGRFWVLVWWPEIHLVSVWHGARFAWSEEGQHFLQKHSQRGRQFAQIETVSYSFVFRSGNSVAHSLARLGLNLEGDCFNVPPGVNSLLTGDFAN